MGRWQFVVTSELPLQSRVRNDGYMAREGKGIQQSLDTPRPMVRSGVTCAYLALAVLLVLTIGRQSWPASINMAGLEVAGTASRAVAARGNASVAIVRTAIFWDFALIAGYMLLLILGLWYFPRRAFRVQAFRRFARIAIVLVLIAAALDVIGNAAMLAGLDRQTANGPWYVAATVSWAKWVILGLVAAYVGVAVATYAVTPAWVQKLLMEPPEPNVHLDPEQAKIPEAHVQVGTPDPSSKVNLEPARFGIAASGGGIRSASLVLGSLQALDDAYPGSESPGPSWATADKITSVSGGSYVAGGFGIARSKRDKDSPAPPPHADAWRAGSPEEKHLLTRLGYLLAPNPTGEPRPSLTQRTSAGSDVPGVVAMVFLGLVLNAAVLFSLLWLLIQPYAWLLKSPAIGCESPTSCSIGTFLVYPVAFWGFLATAVLLLWIGSGWVRAALQPKTPSFALFNFLNRHLRGVLYGLVILTVVLGLTLVVTPALITALPGWLKRGEDLLKPAAVLSGIGSIVALARGLSMRSARFAPYVAGWLFAAVVVLVGVQWLTNAQYDRQAKLLFAGLILGWLVLYTFVSGEWWSLAAFYRGRLRLAFATYLRSQAEAAVAMDSGNSPRETVEPSIYELVERNSQAPDGSPLTICATAHASTRDVRTHYGTPAMSVTISPQTMRVHFPIDDDGGWMASQASTGLIEALMFRRGGARLTTMLAVGLSGAAVSPAMGRYRLGPSKTILAVANVRLGMWLPNPKYAARYEVQQSGTRPEGPHRRVPYPRPRLGYLLKELFGLHDPNDLYIYVTDAGHWENTGLVELIRDRNIDEIVCLDADEQSREKAHQIASAIGLAKLECNATIKLDLDVLRGPYDGRRGTDYSPQSVAVGIIFRGDHLGLLWYAKPVLTRNTPPELLSYAEVDNTFPTTSTIDQFFHTAQFSAYRDLGRYNGREIVEARKALRDATIKNISLDEFAGAAEAEMAHWAVVSIAKLRLSDEQYAKLRELLAEPSTFAPRTKPSLIDVRDRP